MSRIVSNTPATAELDPSETVDITVVVADLPQDIPDATAEVDFTASDGTTGTVAITLNGVDNPDLDVVTAASGTLAANQVRATADVGTLDVIDVQADRFVVRYQAP